jgi:hypothetical protein
MKQCVICDKPLPSWRRKFCGDDCFRVHRVAQVRAKYHADPDFRARSRARAAAWDRANAERRRARINAGYYRRKAARFAAVLAKVQP